MSRSWMCQCRRSWRKSLRLSLAGARRQHGWTCMPVRRTVPGRGENGRSPRRAQPVAAALFDDAARTSLLQVLLVFTSFQDTRHDLVRFFRVFFFGASLRPNGHLVQPRTSARRTRRGPQDGVAYGHTATTSSKLPLQRPRRSTPMMSSSPGSSSRSPLPKTPWTGPWQRRQTMRTTRPCQTRRLSRS